MVKKLKDISISSGCFILSLAIFKVILNDYETGITNLRFGNTVDVVDSPFSYWMSLGLSLLVVGLLLWLAYAHVKLFTSSE